MLGPGNGRTLGFRSIRRSVIGLAVGRELLEHSFVSHRYRVIRRGCGRVLLWSMLAGLMLVASAPRAAVAAEGDVASGGGGDFGPSVGSVGHIDLQPPGPREFILDRAGLISEPEKQKIK